MARRISRGKSQDRPDRDDKLNTMLRALLICPDESTRNELVPALRALPNFRLARILPEYPAPDDLARSVDGVDLLLLWLDDRSKSEALAAGLDRALPAFPIIGVGTGDEPALLLRLMRFGVREVLRTPVEPQALVHAIDAVRHRLKTSPRRGDRRADFCSFLPARAGVGASTIAIGASCALAEVVGSRTLLLDCDLSAGTIGFLLGLEPGTSLLDAFANAGNLDQDMWSHIVSHRGKLDVLQAGNLEIPPDLDLSGMEHILALVRGQYDVICADLASSFDALSIPLLKESQEIFLVATPEPVVLHMAAARARRLRELGLLDRVRLVLNRKTPDQLKNKDIASLVGIPVAYSMPNDYSAVQGAIMSAAPVSQDAGLGQSLLNLAQALAPAGVAPKVPAPVRQHSFLEFFRLQRSKEADDVVWHD